MSHTPVPWEVIGRNIYQVDSIGGREVVHGSGIKGRDSEERDRDDVIKEAEDNAHFIVQACNSHHELLEALIEIEASYMNNRSVHYMAHVAAAAIAKAKE